MIITAVIVVVVAAAAFFGGMQYQKSKVPVVGSGQFANRQGGQGRQGAGGQGGQNGFRPTVGEIIASDEKSITVKLTDGSSKIVLLGSNLTVSKTADGSKGDLTVGTKVGVFGTNNSDGTVTAQNVQINPMFRGPQTSPSPSGK